MFNGLWILWALGSSLITANMSLPDGVSKVSDGKLGLLCIVSYKKNIYRYICTFALYIYISFIYMSMYLKCLWECGLCCAVPFGFGSMLLSGTFLKKLRFRVRFEHYSRSFLHKDFPSAEITEASALAYHGMVEGFITTFESLKGNPAKAGVSVLRWTSNLERAKSMQTLHWRRQI